MSTTIIADNSAPASATELEVAQVVAESVTETAEVVAESVAEAVTEAVTELTPEPPPITEPQTNETNQLLQQILTNQTEFSSRLSTLENLITEEIEPVPVVEEIEVIAEPEAATQQENRRPFLSRWLF